MTKLPIFPLRSVLCPGVALPLHIFEDRYRLMLSRCIERGEPFGVVLLRGGSEVGPLKGEVAAVGTTAAIRRAGSYPDGRLDILTVGEQRFRLDAIDSVSEPYLLGEVSLMDEPTGPEGELRLAADRVGAMFLEYLDLLQPEGVEDGPEIEIEFEIDVDDEVVEAIETVLDDADKPVEQYALEGASGSTDGDELADLLEGDDETLVQEIDAADLPPEERRELLMRAARRLIGTDDPTALSYVLTALIQVDLDSRQELLEVPDTLHRLGRLEDLLVRERWFLRQGLRPIIIDPRSPTARSD